MHPRELAQARLLNQQIAQPSAKTPAEAVTALGALQAQDYTGALWAIGLRLAQATEASVEQALAERTVVRSWPLRGTLHIVAAADIRWMLDLLGPQMIAGNVRRRQQLDLDDATLARGQEVVVNALQEAGQMPRDALCALLESAGISTAGQRCYHILWQLAMRGVLCFGMRMGKQYTFALLDAWAPNAKRLDREAALAELARRYFTGHGPATLQDFVWWSGLKMADARAGLEMASAQLGQVVVDGKRFWMPSTMPTVQSPSPGAYLLPAFDEYILGYRERSAVLDSQHAGKIVPGGNGVFRPIVVVDGQIVGIWRRTLKKNKLTVEVSPFAALSPAAQDAVAAAAAAYSRFLQTEAPVLKWSSN